MNNNKNIAPLNAYICDDGIFYFVMFAAILASRENSLTKIQCKVMAKLSIYAALNRIFNWNLFCFAWSGSRWWGHQRKLRWSEDIKAILFFVYFQFVFFCVLITFKRSRKHGQWSNDRALQLAVCEFYTAISGEFHVVVESVCVEWSLFWVFIWRINHKETMWLAWQFLYAQMLNGRRSQFYFESIITEVCWRARFIIEILRISNNVDSRKCGLVEVIAIKRMRTHFWSFISILYFYKKKNDI